MTGTIWRGEVGTRGAKNAILFLMTICAFTKYFPGLCVEPRNVQCDIRAAQICTSHSDEISAWLQLHRLQYRSSVRDKFDHERRRGVRRLISVKKIISENAQGSVWRDQPMTVVVTEPSCSLESLGDDQLLAILCLLRPSDLAACALVSRRLQFLCQNESHLWFLKCSSEWSSSTRVLLWSALGPPCDCFYRHLHHFLTEWTPLLGFWRDVSGHLYFFRWQATYMECVRLERVRPFCTDLTPVPCLSLELSPGGYPLCLFETAPSSRSGTANGQSPLQRWCGRDLHTESVIDPFSTFHITAKNDNCPDGSPTPKLPSSLSPQNLASGSTSSVPILPPSSQPLPANPLCLPTEILDELPVNIRVVRVQLVGKEHAVIEQCRSPTALPWDSSRGGTSPSPMKYRQASLESDSNMQNDSSGVPLESV